MSRRSWARRFLLVFRCDDRPPVAPRPERAEFRFVVATVEDTLVQGFAPVREAPPVSEAGDAPTLPQRRDSGKGRSREARRPSHDDGQLIMRRSLANRRVGITPAAAPRLGTRKRGRRSVWAPGSGGPGSRPRSAIVAVVWVVGFAREVGSWPFGGQIITWVSVRSRVSWRTRSRLSIRILAKQSAICSISPIPFGALNGERL